MTHGNDSLQPSGAIGSVAVPDVRGEAASGSVVGKVGVPLFVDLDGTLVRTDMLYESLLGGMRKNIGVLLRVPGWLMKGRSELKRRLADLSDPDPQILPYRQDLIAFLTQERARGRKVILATASNQRIAELIAGHLGIFDGVMASDGVTNLKGVHKLREINRLYPGPFEYVGDSSADKPLFEAAEAYYVAGSGTFSTLARPPKLRFNAPATSGVQRSKAGHLFKLIRPHQWVKNILLFVPLLTAQKFGDVGLLIKCILGAVAFSLLASSVYVVNDLLDVESDRRHHRKRNRPIAAGTVSIPLAVVMAVALLVTGLGISGVLLPGRFAVIALSYLVVSTLYSVHLKRKLIIDVLCLAGLYTMRIFAGGAATSIVVSPWLLAFSMFLFLSLAFAKRFTELATAISKSDAPSLGGHGVKAAGRGYYAVDLDLIRSLGPTAGYLAVMVLALYVSSPDVLQHYKSPAILYYLCPALLYWITRVWFLAQRQELHDDPVVFALRDRNSHLVGVACGLVLLAAKFL